MVNAAYARAVRNCPWVGQLWGRALRALEQSEAPEEQHAALYDRALAAGLQVGRWGGGLHTIAPASTAWHDGKGGPPQSPLLVRAGYHAANLYCMLPRLYCFIVPQSYEDYLEVVLARLDCLRRRGAEALPKLRTAFRRAADLLHSYFPDHLDRTFRWGVGRAWEGAGLVLF